MVSEVVESLPQLPCLSTPLIPHQFPPNSVILSPVTCLVGSQRSSCLCLQLALGEPFKYNVGVILKRFCNGKFWRSGNIQIVCERLDILCVESFEELVAAIKDMLKEKGMKLDKDGNLVK